MPFSDTEKQIKSAPDDINQYASTIWLYNNEPQLALDDSHLDFAIIPTPNPWWLKILIHQPLPNNFTISGIQGQLWSETVRSDEQAEYMIYPRLLALAERACHQASWQVPYNANGGQYSKGSNVFNQQFTSSKG
nr:family 20 glycosylhydrolase [Colwellia sp.]